MAGSTPNYHRGTVHAAAMAARHRSAGSAPERTRAVGCLRRLLLCRQRAVDVPFRAPGHICVGNGPPGTRLSQRCWSGALPADEDRKGVAHQQCHVLFGKQGRAAQLEVPRSHVPICTHTAGERTVHSSRTAHQWQTGHWKLGMLPPLMPAVSTWTAASTSSGAATGVTDRCGNCKRQQMPGKVVHA